MRRILTRKWFWLLVTSVAPVLWQVLAGAPSDDLAPQPPSAAEAKAVKALCHRLDPHACPG